MIAAGLSQSQLEGVARPAGSGAGRELIAVAGIGLCRNDPYLRWEWVWTIR